MAVLVAISQQSLLNHKLLYKDLRSSFFVLCSSVFPVLGVSFFKKKIYRQKQLLISGCRKITIIITIIPQGILNSNFLKPEQKPKPPLPHVVGGEERMNDFPRRQWGLTLTLMCSGVKVLLQQTPCFILNLFYNHFTIIIKVLKKQKTKQII